EGTEPSSETTKAMLKTVQLKGLNVGVNGVKFISKGGLAVECRSKDEVSVLSLAIKNASLDVDIKETKKSNPTFTMWLPGKDYDLDDLRQEIINKNQFISDTSD